MKTTRLALALATSSLVCAGAQAADVQITEFMYNGADATGEYIEFTNLGTSAIDFSGWSFDDDSRVAGTVDLSGFGWVGAGQSVILTEAAAADFRSAWSLSTAVKVIGGNTANLGRADEINLFDATGTLVDRLTYGDNVVTGTPRAQNSSANPGTLADLTPFTITSGWKLSAAGDLDGSRASTLGDIGNPGAFVLAVPEPGEWAMLVAGLGVIGAVVRRRSA